LHTAITNENGEIQLIDGPARIKVLTDMRITQLHAIHADAHSYLQVKRLNGTSEHIPGPTSMYLKVGEDESIVPKPAIILSSNEALVVYRRLKGDKSASAAAAAGEFAIYKFRFCFICNTPARAHTTQLLLQQRAQRRRKKKSWTMTMARLLAFTPATSSEL
jgi:hypothetical protein